MKLIAIALIALSSNFAHAWDAVAVFYKPEKVIVQINESYPAARLEALLTATGSTDSWSFLSDDQSFKAECDRGTLGITCIFRFLPSDTVTVDDKKAQGFIQVALIDSIELAFLNSNGDNVQITGDNVGLIFKAAKKAK